MQTNAPCLWEVCSKKRAFMRRPNHEQRMCCVLPNSWLPDVMSDHATTIGQMYQWVFWICISGLGFPRRAFKNTEGPNYKTPTSILSQMCMNCFLFLSMTVLLGSTAQEDWFKTMGAQAVALVEMSRRSWPVKSSILFCLTLFGFVWNEDTPKSTGISYENFQTQ